MSYCNSQDVQAEFKDIEFGGNSVITVEQVTEWIRQGDARIDARIGTKYQVPLTGTTALLLVKTISIWFAAHRIQSKLRVKTGDSKTEQDPARDFYRDAMKMLDDIVENKITLGSDQPLASSADGVSSFNNDTGYESQFLVDTDQW